MNVLVVYDSWYGNTEQLARAIADRLGSARLVKAKALGSLDLAGCDLLVIGSPTHAGGISLGLRFAVPRIPAAVVRGVSVAAFDTRFHEDVSHTGSRRREDRQEPREEGRPVGRAAGELLCERDEGPPGGGRDRARLGMGGDHPRHGAGGAPARHAGVMAATAIWTAE